MGIASAAGHPRPSFPLLWQEYFQEYFRVIFIKRKTMSGQWESNPRLQLGRLA